MSFTMLLSIGVILLLLVGLSLVFTILYRRTEKSRAYVRTGMGGQKVVLDGGSVVLPIFHSINWVNLQTLRLEIKREHSDAMITKDRMRVDIGVEFYVRVDPEHGAIALAAQTLGDRTENPVALREQVEAKFVDVLRSVAARMTLFELQEKREDFIQAVQTTVADELRSNGLKLESASLTRLDQTDTKYFNPNNAFDAEGLTALTEITEQKKRQRNDIVRQTEVAIAEQDLTAKQKTLTIDLQRKEAELSQQRDVVNKTAATRAESAQKEASAREAEETARIDADRAIAQRRATARQAEEAARITSEQAVAIAEQDRSIAVAERSRAESEARAQAEEARAKAVKSEEAVLTARHVAQAERAREIAVIAARQEADQEATRITVAATASKNAALDQAEAAKNVAEGEAQALRIRAEAEATSVRVRAEAEAVRYGVEAEGQRLLNASQNLLSPEMVKMQVDLKRLSILPDAIAAATKPMEKISDVRILDMGGRAQGLPGSTPGASNALVDQLLNYRAQAPVVDTILQHAGFKTSDGNMIDALVQSATPPKDTSSS